MKMKITNHHIKNHHSDDILLFIKEFNCKTGDRVALIGENGSGKTSFLKEIFAKEIQNGSRVSLITTEFQKAIEDLLVFEFIEATLSDQTKVKAFLKYFEKYNLHEAFIDKPIVKLSGGERKILEIELALFSNPEILLIDEPESNLNDFFLSIVSKSLIEQSKNSILIFTSHNSIFIENVSNVKYAIQNKELVKNEAKEINDSKKKGVFNVNFEFIED